MSVTSVRPFYKNRLEILGFTQWSDGFNFENIPSTILDKAFHIQVNSTAGGVISPHVQNINMPVTIRVFRKGFRDVSAGIDSALADVESIICDILAPSVRLGSAIKNVVLDDFSVNPLADSNDNAIMLELNFTNLIVLEI